MPQACDSGFHGTRPKGADSENSGSQDCQLAVALQVEQGSLAVEATAVAGEGAVGADHAVAGDDDRDRVAAVGGADDAGALPRLDVGLEEGGVDLLGLLAVADGLAVGDL